MMPRLLDLYCGAGGAGWGYHLAGFDVVGVDIEPQPSYPFEFHQGDALGFLAEHGSEFDAVHASPPCKGWTVLTNVTRREYESTALLPATLKALRTADIPHVVENVVGSGPVMGNALQLCGSSFGLLVRRHRYFVTSFACLAPPCNHASQPYVVSVSGHGAQGWAYKRERPPETQAERCAAMGIDWMNRDELAQAIPPAYTRYLGEQLLEHVEGAAA